MSAAVRSSLVLTEDSLSDVGDDLCAEMKEQTPHPFPDISSSKTMATQLGRAVRKVGFTFPTLQKTEAVFIPNGTLDKPSATLAGRTLSCLPPRAQPQMPSSANPEQMDTTFSTSELRRRASSLPSSSGSSPVPSSGHILSHLASALS